MESGTDTERKLGERERYSDGSRSNMLIHL